MTLTEDVAEKGTEQNASLSNASALPSPLSSRLERRCARLAFSDVQHLHGCHTRSRRSASPLLPSSLPLLRLRCRTCRPPASNHRLILRIRGHTSTGCLRRGLRLLAFAQQTQPPLPLPVSTKEAGRQESGYMITLAGRQWTTGIGRRPTWHARSGARGGVGREGGCEIHEIT